MEKQGIACIMRSLVLLLLLHSPAYGDERIDCSSVAAYNLTAGYAEPQLVEVTWLTDVDGGPCRGARYRVCLGAAAAAACHDVNTTSWRGRTDRTCADYSVAVTAFDRGGGPLAAVNATFLSSPAAVEDLAVGSRTSSSLQLSWRAPPGDGCAEGYQVLWRLRTEVVNEGSAVVGPRATGYEVAGLRPCTVYELTLLTLFGGGDGAAQRLSAYTAAHGYPAMVTDLEVTRATSDEVSLAWTASASPCVAAYRTCLRRFFSANKTCWVHTTRAFTTPATLTPCTNYSVGVAAIDVGGQVSAEAPRSVATAPGEVRNLTVASRAADHLVLSWEPPVGDRSCLAGVELRVRGGSAARETVVTLGPGETSHRTSGLDACEVYDVEVTSAGPGSLQRSRAARLAAYTDVASEQASRRPTERLAVSRTQWRS
ncbi:receptor-type tyrosine-protein phosphatase H-like [Bacillus rossius redtenbacheri]|uniref:receptor-type tyrosine-protein phosphatase H-like n=1 Tax=Bacillus rossius redtenbacheri TaxID=93214 RepID=UPI002FDE9539